MKRLSLSWGLSLAAWFQDNGFSLTELVIFGLKLTCLNKIRIILNIFQNCFMFKAVFAATQVKGELGLLET